MVVVEKLTLESLLPGSDWGKALHIHGDGERKARCETELVCDGIQARLLRCWRLKSCTRSLEVVVVVVVVELVVMKSGLKSAAWRLIR